MSKPSFFILGVGRSGTSILQEILSLHSRLMVSHELRVLELLVLAAALVDARGEPPQKTPVTYSSLGLAVGHGFVEALGLAQLEAEYKPGGIWGDKYPPYCEHLAVLDRLFPQARFVHILRDGRDVVASALQAFVTDRGWRRSASVPSAHQLAHNWVRNVKLARGYGAKLPTDRYLELRYEELVQHKHVVLAPLLGFLGLEPEASLERMAARLRPGKTWRETLSHAELAQIDAIPSVKDLLAELGYPPTPVALDDPGAEGTTLAWTLGVDGSAAWSRLAREARAASNERRAEFCALRAFRDSDKELGAARELLSEPKCGASPFAALNLRGDESVATRAALVGWVEARGLDALAARALFEVRELAP